MSAPSPNAQLLSPAVRAEGQADYTMRFELKADVITPALYVQLYPYSASGALLEYWTIATFHESTDWVKGSYPLRLAELPPGTESVRLVFKWWSASEQPNGTAWIRGLYLGRLEVYNLAVANVADTEASTWDAYAYESTIMWTGESTVRRGGLVFRYQDTRNYYFAELDGNAGVVRLGKMEKGEIWILAEKAADVTKFESYRVKAKVAGNRIQVYLGDRLLTEAVDNSFAAGKVGLRVGEGSSAYFDDVRVVYEP
jgi:hypothetical protein